MVARPTIAALIVTGWVGLSGAGQSAAQSCAYVGDGECDEPGIGTQSCALGTDRVDCAGIGFDTCDLAYNGRCDEPTNCPIGSDTADCRPAVNLGSPPSGEPPRLAGDCFFTSDGQCDEPGIGSGLCDAGTDGVDCGALSGTMSGTGIPLEHSCQYALDGQCDEPGQGTGNCPAGTDVWDCALPPEIADSIPPDPTKPNLKPAETGPAQGLCLFYGNGRCDEPGIGTGLCPADSDGLDCVSLRQ